MTSRAQTTSEFVIILAILLIGIAIFTAGVIDFPKFGTNTQNTILNSYWDSQDIAIIESISNGSDVTLVIKNNIKYSVEVQSIQLDSITKNVDINLRPGETNTYSTAVPLENTYVGISYLNQENGQIYFLEGPGLEIIE